MGGNFATRFYPALLDKWTGNKEEVFCQSQGDPKSENFSMFVSD